HLARRLGEGPIALLGAFRVVGPEPGGPVRDALAELRREGLSETVALAPLGRAEVGALVAALLGARPAAPVVDAIHRQSEGNPFFAGELTRHLLEEGRDLTDARAPLGDVGVPEGIRLVIGKRLARLGPDTRRMLQAAAVLGEVFPAALIKPVAEIATA